MRVLDLDMDFFLADVCPLAEKGERPCLNGHEPWPEDEIRLFLEKHCGLSRENPVPGRIFETHDQALDFWKDLMAQGRLSAPFDVTHVDAHSDLGIGKPGPGFVLNSVLCRAPVVRADLEQYRSRVQLDEANYLLFALAFRWISSLENVRNPKSRPDFPAQLACETKDERVTSIRLWPQVRGIFEKLYGAEPEIPYRTFENWHDFCAQGPYDFVSMAISPRYAPKEADFIAEILGEYISCI